LVLKSFIKLAFTPQIPADKKKSPASPAEEPYLLLKASLFIKLNHLVALVRRMEVEQIAHSIHLLRTNVTLSCSSVAFTSRVAPEVPAPTVL